MSRFRLLGLSFLMWVLLSTFAMPVMAQLGAPTLIAPASSSTATSSRPTFQWQAVPGATSYTLSIYNDAALTELYSSATTSATSYSQFPYGLADGTYYWFVTARNNTVTSPRSEVRGIIWNVQISPTNGAVLSNTTPTFSWNALPVARNGTLLLVDNNTDFSSPEFSCVRSEPNLTCTPTTPLVPGQYYWRVDYNISNRIGRTVWSFTISDTTPGQRPGTPSITSPASAFQISNSRQLNIVWSGVSPATSYDVQVDNNDNFGSPEFTGSASAPTTQLTTSSLPADGRYYLRVRAVNNGSVGEWSGVVWGDVDTTAPPAPQPFEPASGSTISYTRTPTLRYYASSGQNLYRVEVATDAQFGNLMFPTVETTAHHITVASALANGTYYWRAQERDPAGNWSAWSVTSTFTITGS